MNVDILEGKWKEIKGQVKEKWGKLTDDDLTKVEGKVETYPSGDRHRGRSHQNDPGAKTVIAIWTG